MGAFKAFNPDRGDDILPIYTNAKRARFTCVAANTIISSQLGVPSA